MNTLEFFIAVFIEFSAAFAGVYLAYRGGIKQDRNMRREEGLIIKRELVKSLRTEIDENVSIIEHSLINQEINPGAIYKPVFPPYLLTSSYESSVGSGKFDMLSPEIQTEISTFYSGCNRINELNRLLGTRSPSERESKWSVIERTGVWKSLLAIVENLKKNLDRE